MNTPNYFYPDLDKRCSIDAARAEKKERKMVEVNIKLYDITKCGYYKPRVLSPFFGSTKETLEQIEKWIQEKPLRDRSTFDPQPDSSILKGYFLEILKSTTGDYYLSVWNSVPMTDQNTFAAISEQSLMGQAQSNMMFRNFGKGYIPGFATYFWISPLENRLSTVRFERSYNGHQSFKYLFHGFLKNNPNYANQVREVNKRELIIQGYSANDENDTICFPYFQTSGIKKSGPINYIKNNISHVTKVHGQSIIVPGSKKSLTIYNRFLDLIGSSKSESNSLDYKVFYEFPCSLNSSDFNSIYKKWQEEQTDLFDVGFVIGKETYWLSKEIQKTEIKLNIPRLNDELYDLKYIMDEIEKNKGRILDECAK